MVVRIIVIDNDKDIRDLLTTVFRDEGWDVFSYDYAHIDLATLKNLFPDLIILDFDNRPASKAGWEFLQLLKMEDMTANIAILITTTAFHLSAEIRGYLLAHHIHIVSKPFELEPLLLLVQNILTLANQTGILFSSDQSLPILVIEEEADLREAIATVLRLEGYEVVTAANGLGAFDDIANAKYGLILLDIAMPILDGLEFLRSYNQQREPHTPVIIISADSDNVTQVLPSFVIDVLSKPFEIGHLLQKVKRYGQRLTGNTTNNGT